ncbi:hypothetical protein ILFOPFJJ_02506 [Ensifer psoraleae]|nr:hypothetical protein [Sinorhizobium psoraleae]
MLKIVGAKSKILFTFGGAWSNQLEADQSRAGAAAAMLPQT